MPVVPYSLKTQNIFYLTFFSSSQPISQLCYTTKFLYTVACILCLNSSPPNKIWSCDFTALSKLTPVSTSPNLTLRTQSSISQCPDSYWHTCYPHLDVLSFSKIWCPSPLLLWFCTVPSYYSWFHNIRMSQGAFFSNYYLFSLPW